MKQKLTALIPSYNEEENIGACLESVKWADEVLVVDSFSTDRTIEIARKYTDRIIQHEYINSATQKNWAIPQASHKWILIVDSDERVTPRLRAEIELILEGNPSDSGFYIPRKNFFLGCEVKHGGWGYKNDLNIRLFMRDRGRYEEKEVHADMIIDGTVGMIKEPFIHYSYNSLDQYIRKMKRYTDWAAIDVCKKHKHIGVAHLLFRPCFTFFKMYVLKAGFLDGIRGIILAVLSSYYVYIKYAKAWERLYARQQNQQQEPS